MAPFYPPLPEARPANLVGSALAGYGAVQDVQNAQTRNALGQIQLEKAQRGESALQAYGQTRDVEAAMAIDPKTGMELSKRLSEKNKAEIDIIKDNIDIFNQKKAYYVGNPEAYAADYGKLHPDLKRAMPAPDKLAAMAPA